MAILTDEPERELLVVLDGLENVISDGTGTFKHGIRDIREFFDHLQQRIFNMKVLLTSQTWIEVKEDFDDLPYIVHDKERLGMSSGLFQAVD